MIPSRPWPATSSIRSASSTGPAAHPGDAHPQSWGQRPSRPPNRHRRSKARRRRWRRVRAAEPRQDLRRASTRRAEPSNVQANSGSAVTSSVLTMVRLISPSTAAIVLVPYPPRGSGQSDSAGGAVCGVVGGAVGFYLHRPLHHAATWRFAIGESASPPTSKPIVPCQLSGPLKAKPHGAAPPAPALTGPRRRLLTRPGCRC
jgi:hypothetical protein